MPVGPYPDFDACLRANRDKTDPAAYCAWLEDQMKGTLMAETWIVADVTYDTDEDAREAERLARENKLAGISADVADVTSTVEVVDTDDMGNPTDWLETASDGELIGATQVPMPAFADARIVATPEGLIAYVIPEGIVTSDRRTFQPGSLRWRDPTPLMFLDRTTDAHREAVYVGNLSNFRRVDIGLTAAAFPILPEWFTDPDLPHTSRIRVEDGRLVGHGAAWGVCHTAYPHTCLTAPHTATDYQHARWKTVDGHTGVPVYEHPNGDHHAPVDLPMDDARHWYDQHCDLVGLVEVGEDEHGIWAAGAAANLNGEYLSGDWRWADTPDGRNLELIGFLVVDNPGYPIAQVAHDQPAALVAAGIVTRDDPHRHRRAYAKALTARIR